VIKGEVAAAFLGTEKKKKKEKKSLKDVVESTAVK